MKITEALDLINTEIRTAKNRSPGFLKIDEVSVTLGLELCQSGGGKAGFECVGISIGGEASRASSHSITLRLSPMVDVLPGDARSK